VRTSGYGRSPFWRQILSKLAQIGMAEVHFGGKFLSKLAQIGMVEVLFGGKFISELASRGILCPRLGAE